MGPKESLRDNLVSVPLTRSRSNQNSRQIRYRLDFSGPKRMENVIAPHLFHTLWLAINFDVAPWTTCFAYMRCGARVTHTVAHGDGISYSTGRQCPHPVGGGG